jgi:hypothetical protein
MKIGIVRNTQPATSTSSILSPLIANVPPPPESSESAGMGTVNDNYLVIGGTSREVLTLSGDLLAI